MNPDWRKVNLNSEENVLVWLQVPQDETEADVSCTCYLTDTVNIYTEHLNTSIIQSRFTEQNPGLETEDFLDFLNNLRAVLAGSPKSTISVTREGDTCRINIDWIIEGIDFKWFFQTNIQPHQLLCEVFYLPFIHLSQHLLHTKDSLLRIIQDKDLEIEDYENNGSKLSRKKLRTGRFDPEKDLEVFDDEKTSGPATTVDIVDSPKMREILRTISVKAFCEVKTETKGIKDGDTTSSKERMISESSPAQILNNPPAQNSDKTLTESEEDKSIKKIMTEKPNLKRIAQSSSNRFKLNKKKKF